MKMTHRERVLKTFRFEETDRPPYDLMEAATWESVERYFRDAHGLENGEAIQDFLDTDFRWSPLRYVMPDEAEEAPPPPPPADEPSKTYSWAVAGGPLAQAETVADVEAYRGWQYEERWQPGDYRASRARYPDHALVLGNIWKPLFWGACEAFGMEEALVRLHTDPVLVDAFIERQQAFYMTIMRRAAREAEGLCDICWLADDYAGQRNMLIAPDVWRRHIKPHLAEQVRLVREHGMYALLHSCGAIRDIIPDLLDIGVNGLLVFQTTARGMDAESIAREFGGKMAFYGGVDVQHLLSFGTVEEVKATVRSNRRAFAECGGYIVANSHHCVDTVKGENLAAMCEAARER